VLKCQSTVLIPNPEMAVRICLIPLNIKGEKMILKKLMMLKEQLQGEYLQSHMDIESAFKRCFEIFKKEKTTITLLNRNYQIEKRMTMLRRELTPIIQVPIYESLAKTIVQSRLDEMPDVVNTKSKYYKIIDSVEPFIYLEEE